MDEDKCKECSKDLSTDEASKIAIICDGCSKWHCYSCLGLTKYMFDAVKRFSESGKDDKHKCNVFISCKSCMQSVMPVAAIKKGSSIETKSILEKIDGINDIIKENIDISMKKIESNIKENIVKEIESIKVKLEESKANQVEEAKSNVVRWADIVQRNTNTEASLIKVTKALDNSAKDIASYEEQDKSLIFFNKPESKKDISRDRYDEDEKFIKDFISVGLHIPSQPIQSVFRLGKASEDKSRPIKVIFQHKSSQVSIMHNLSSLREADDVYKNINVMVDRSKEVRALFKSKSEEARKRTLDSPDKRYVVRGQYSPFIKELPK